MFGRNFPIISEETQARIKKVRVLFIGCGLGSNVAELFTRTGVENFYLIDGDDIEDTNLNRQEFFQKEIGRNKARVLSERIKKINPSASVRINENYINTKRDLEDIIDWPDFIVNTSDFTKGFFEYNVLGSEKNKTVICPFNVGFGSVVLLFNKSNISLQKEINIAGLSDSEYFSLLLTKARQYKVPEYFLPIFKKIQDGSISYTPQLGVASRLTSALIVSLVVRKLAGEDINVFPHVHTIDLKNV